MIEIPTEWSLDPENKESKKLNEILSSQARHLQKAIAQTEEDKEKYAALFSYYRKYYQLTLSKTSLSAGINKSPTRDYILDFPWKELKLNRFQCLKVWEKINH